MQLKDWREKHGKSRQDVAEHLGTDVSTIFRWELPRGHTDKRVPTGGYMDGIFQLTRGLVDPNSFYELELNGAQRELPLEAACEAPALPLPPPADRAAADHGPDDGGNAPVPLFDAVGSGADAAAAGQPEHYDQAQAA